jgi:phage shock protein A
MSVQIIKRFKSLLIIWALAVLVVGCATTAPVQEMSNARQTIASALEVKAEIYAPRHLETAEKLMEQATDALESGNYTLAREYAVSAQQYAVKARQQAISKQK